MTGAGEVQLVMPRGTREFQSLARLAAGLASHHAEVEQPAVAALCRDHGRWFDAVLARTAEGVDVAFAAWHGFYIVQKGQKGIELQNLFVEEDWRGRKIGFLLVCHVVREALAAQCDLLHIGVRKDNALAIAFYQRLGCRLTDRNVNWRCSLDAAGMRALLEAAGG